MVGDTRHIVRFLRKIEDKALADKLDKNELITSLQLAGIMVGALPSLDTDEEALPLFDNREIAVMAMCIEHYENSDNCPEPNGVREVLRECVRKLHFLIDIEGE